MTQKPARKLSFRERFAGIARVARITYQASPFAVFIKIIGTIITATLPIVTTYYAALTTTALAEAYAGDDTAGARAITYVIVTAALGLLLTIWSSVEQYINQLVRYRIDAAINDRLYERFLNLDFWRYDDKRTADLFDKSQRFSQFFAHVFDRISDLSSSVVQMIAGLVALLFVSWWLGLILLIAVIPSLVLQLKLSRMQARHWNENVETRRKKGMIEYQMLTIDRIAELRLYGLVRSLLDLRQTLRDKDEKERIQHERHMLLPRLASDAVETAAEVIALVYTTLQIIAHTQPIGQFLFVQQITSRTLNGARGLVSGISSIDEDLANLFDYNEFMQLEESAKRPISLTNQPKIISFQNVSFHYPANDTLVLNGISLDITKGSHIALVGENGAGKSTLIKLILGMYTPTSGTITLDDQPLDQIALDSWHRYIGVLQQEFGVYPFATARENVLFGDVSKPISTEAFERAVRNAEADTFLSKLSKGYDNYVYQWMEHDDGTPGVDLSGGQKQRLALARNFYRDSPIIILDEPTSAIDALAESRIFDNLFAMKDRTIITISHRLNTVKKADTIYMLEQGKIVEQGTHTELLRKKGAYYTLFESQL